jgi:hypothetical protein
MITKTDWQAVRDEMAAADGRSAGAAPSADEMMAYERGELAEADADRVRGWLVANPDVARALIEPFPGDGAGPGDPGFLSEAQLSKQWMAFQQRIHGRVPEPAARVVRYPARWIGLAAAIALVFAGLFWRADSEVRRLTRQLSEPRMVGQHGGALWPDQNRRGGGEEPLVTVPAGRDADFDVMLGGESPFQQYRLELSETGSEPSWKSPASQAVDGALSIHIPHEFLKPGNYRMVVYGVAGTHEERLDSYSFRVVRR